MNLSTSFFMPVDNKLQLQNTKNQLSSIANVLICLLASASIVLCTVNSQEVYVRTEALIVEESEVHTYM